MTAHAEWWLRAEDIDRPGPSPWWICPTCGWRFRRLRFTVWDDLPCPVCATRTKGGTDDPAGVLLGVEAKTGESGVVYGHGDHTRPAE